MLGKLGDMAKLMKNFKEIQKSMEAKQKELHETFVTGEAGAGDITVKVTARCSQPLTIDTLDISDAAWSEGKEIVSEMVTAATNDASYKVGEKIKSVMPDPNELMGG